MKGSFDSFISEAVETNAHREAAKLGLQYKGFGHYLEPKTGRITHKTENGELVPISNTPPITPDSGGPGDPDTLKQKNPLEMGMNKMVPGSGVLKSPEPGMEQAPHGANWNPGPDGDHCVGDQPAPDDLSFDMFVGKTNYYKWTAGKDGSNYKNISAKQLRDDEPLQQEQYIHEEGEGLPSPGNMSPSSNGEKLAQQGFSHTGFNNYVRDDGTRAKVIGGEIVYYNGNGEVSTEDQGGLKMIGSKPTWQRPHDGQSMTPPAQPETPEEIKSIPEPTPASAPTGYDKFMMQKSIEAKFDQDRQEEIDNKSAEIDQLYSEHPLSRAFKIRMDNLIADASQSQDPDEKVFAANLQDVVNDYAQLFHMIISNTEDDKTQMKMIAALSAQAQQDAMSRNQEVQESKKLSFDKFLAEEDEFASFKGMDPAKLAQLRKLADAQQNPSLRRNMLASALKGHQAAMANQQNTPQQQATPLAPQVQKQAAADTSAIRRGLDGASARKPSMADRMAAGFDKNVAGKDQGSQPAQPEVSQEKPVTDVDGDGDVDKKDEIIQKVRSKFFSGDRVAGAASTDIKEASSLYSFYDMMVNGNEINDENMAERVKKAQEYYGISAKEAKDLLSSSRNQTSALRKYLKKRGIEGDDLKDFIFSRVGGNDDDIPEEFRDNDNVFDTFNEKLRTALGDDADGIFQSRQKDAWNPTDVYALRKGKGQEILQGLSQHLEGLEGKSFEEKQNAVKMISALARNYVDSNDMLPISLKHTPGVGAKAAEQNYHELTDKGIEAIATSVLSDVGMDISLGDKKHGRGGKSGPVDFGNNELSFNLAMRMKQEFEDQGVPPEQSDMFVKYYLLGNTAKQDRWMNLKNESKPLTKGKRKGTAFTAAAEKLGSIPVEMLTEHLKEMRQIPEGEDDDYMMGMEKILNPSREEVEAQFPLGKNGKRTAAAQKKFDEAMKNAGLPSGKSRFRDINEDEIDYYGNMLEEIFDQNEKNKSIPEGENKNVKNGVNVKLDTKIGDREYGKGEMREYMRGVADIEKAMRLAKNGKDKEAQEIMEKYFGKGASTKDYKNRFSQNTRNQMTRIAVARQLQRLHESGDLSKVMAQAIMRGQKVAFSKDKPGFPFLKLGAESGLDPKDFGLEEELEFTLDTTYLV